MKKPTILYAEDDETLAFLTIESLEQAGFEVAHCTDGNIGFEMFKTNAFDVCILDIMMQNADGFELAANIRKQNTNIPILFLSAKTLKEDRIKGLKIGADDYLIKPFSMEELVLKIDVFLRRSQKTILQHTSFFKIGDFELDAENYVVLNNGHETKLTQREAALLQFFIENKNKVLKREQILTALWGDDDYFLGRSLDVFISRLRKIIAHDTNLSIENLHGIGFRFNEKIL